LTVLLLAAGFCAGLAVPLGSTAAVRLGVLSVAVSDDLRH